MRAAAFLTALALVLTAAILLAYLLQSGSSRPEPTYGVIPPEPTPAPTTHQPPPVKPHKEQRQPDQPAETAPTPDIEPPAPPEPEPVPDTEWILVDQRQFSGRKPLADYLPYYVIQAGEVGRHNRGDLILWHHYQDEQPVEYRPDEEFLLDCSRVFDRWVRLTKQAPHTVKWLVEFHAVGGARGLRIEPNGVVLTQDFPDEGFEIFADRQHMVAMERVGGALKVSLDGGKPITKEVDPDDREPLRISAQVVPAVLRTSSLYFAKGEGLSPPPEPKGQAVPPEWEVVYSQDFSDPASVKSFTGWPAAGLFEWAADSKALRMGPREDIGIEEMYVMLQRSLPGDLRIRFRARSIEEGQPAFFGLMLFLKGGLRKEEGYFVEWNYWQVQIKRKNIRVAGKEIGYGKPSGNKQWVNFMVQRVGHTITMFTEGKEVLEWADPYPFRDSEHDLFCFYIWRVPMEYDDIVIERNANDKILPRADHPVFEENYIQGLRNPDEGVEAEFLF